MIGFDYAVSFLPLLILPFALFLSVKLSRIELSRGVTFLIIECTATLFSAALLICILAFIKPYLGVGAAPWVFGLDTLPDWHILVQLTSPAEVSAAFWSVLFLAFSSSIFGSLLTSRITGFQWKTGIGLTFLFDSLIIASIAVLSLLIGLAIWRY